MSLLPNDDEDLMNGDDDDSSLDFDNSSELLNAISADDLQTWDQSEPMQNEGSF